VEEVVGVGEEAVAGFVVAVDDCCLLSWGYRLGVEGRGGRHLRVPCLRRRRRLWAVGLARRRA